MADEVLEDGIVDPGSLDTRAGGVVVQISFGAAPAHRERSHAATAHPPVMPKRVALRRRDHGNGTDSVRVRLGHANVCVGHTLADSSISHLHAQGWRVVDFVGLERALGELKHIRLIPASIAVVCCAAKRRKMCGSAPSLCQNLVRRPILSCFHFSHPSRGKIRTTISQVPRRSEAASRGSDEMLQCIAHNQPLLGTRRCDIHQVQFISADNFRITEHIANLEQRRVPVAIPFDGTAMIDGQEVLPQQHVVEFETLGPVSCGEQVVCALQIGWVCAHINLLQLFDEFRKIAPVLFYDGDFSLHLQIVGKLRRRLECLQGRLGVLHAVCFGFEVFLDEPAHEVVSDSIKLIIGLTSQPPYVHQLTKSLSL